MAYLCIQYYGSSSFQCLISYLGLQEDRRFVVGQAFAKRSQLEEVKPYSQLKNTQIGEAQRKHRADTRKYCSHFRPSDATSCYFLVVFERIKPLDMDLPFNPVEKKWRPLIEDAWNPVKNSIADLIDGIPALVRATRPILTASDEDVPKQWFADLAANVHRTLGNLQQTKAEYVKGGTARVTAFDTAVSSI
ncbi:hypothetical protein BDR04DRAFT_1114268 [Suillus decipiens]|nr:hypothetical protein BDR04DRAFT_1114268 [Suillus decipiens]